MKQPNFIIWERDESAGFVEDGSQVAEDRPAVKRCVCEEEKAFFEAIDCYLLAHPVKSLGLENVFEIVQALGYRKVKSPSAPPATEKQP